MNTTTTDAEPDDLVAWLTREAGKATRDAEKHRAAAMDALCSGHESGALFDAETRSDAMATAFRLAADKARFIRRRAVGQDRAVVPVMVLGAVEHGSRGVLVQRGAERFVLFPDGSEIHEQFPFDPDPDEAVWGPLLREHDENRAVPS